MWTQGWPRWKKELGDIGHGEICLQFFLAGQSNMAGRKRRQSISPAPTAYTDASKTCSRPPLGRRVPPLHANIDTHTTSGRSLLRLTYQQRRRGDPVVLALVAWCPAWWAEEASAEVDCRTTIRNKGLRVILSICEGPK
jgi:hypothetical protein